MSLDFACPSQEFYLKSIGAKQQSKIEHTLYSRVDNKAGLLDNKSEL
jgi:hypothetical protein